MLATLATMAIGLVVAPGAGAQAPAPHVSPTVTQTEGDTSPAYVLGKVETREHAQEVASDGASQPPLSSFDSVHRSAYGGRVVLPKRPSVSDAAASTSDAQGCVDRLNALSGAEFATQVEQEATACLNALFDLSGDTATAIFSEENMRAVADRLRDRANANEQTDATSLVHSVLFLRAGYYAHSHATDGSANYSTSLRAATGDALESVFANQQLNQVTSANGEVLAEAVTLVDSADLNSQFLQVVENLLNDYDKSYDSSPWTLAAVNGAFTVLYGGHDDPEFAAAAADSPTLLRTLHRFATRNADLLGGDRSYLPTNAARELGRFLSTDATRAAARPLVRALLEKSTLKERTAPMWVGVAEMTQSYDKNKCGYYGNCKTTAAAAAAVAVAKTTYTCSASITIKAQSMTSSEFASTCSSLRSQDSYFHSIARDPGPVANDYNTRIEVVVYDSSADYKYYAGSEYGIDTNNGGMYLEGNPAASGNQARFIAYEAEWVRPQFAIWNLNHEYTHYLDGRFNMYGDFGAGTTTPTIWWIEGFAEYISYSYRNEPYTAAQSEAALGTYTLRTLFDTTYSNDSNRIYRWGYLAAAFMVNKHPNELQTVLNYYRTGNWNAARTYLTSSIGTRYDAEFRTFLSQCAAGNCTGGGTTTNRAPTASFSSSASGLTVSFTDASTDPDGTIASRSWSFGDGTSSTSANPSKTYASAGSYTVSLTVTDNGGATNTVTKTVNVTTGGGTTLPECTDPDVRKLDRGCQRSGRSATTGNNDYLFIYVPAGVSQLQISSQGGSGDADLYYSPSTWATPSNYTLQSSGAGNNGSITVNNPAAGYHYITLNAATSFSNVTVSVQ